MAGWGQGRLRIIAAATVIAGCAPARAGQGDLPAKRFTPAQVQFFETEVQPILKARCLKCHGEGPKVRGGLSARTHGRTCCAGVTWDRP